MFGQLWALAEAAPAYMRIFTIMMSSPDLRLSVFSEPTANRTHILCRACEKNDEHMVSMTSEVIRRVCAFNNSAVNLQLIQTE
jgi:hypothetical protein